jgi:hypothetical protein
VDVRVDEAGQEREPFEVERAVGSVAPYVLDPGDPSVRDCDGGRGLACAPGVERAYVPEDDPGGGQTEFLTGGSIAPDLGSEHVRRPR